MYLSCQRARAEIYSVSLTLSAFVKAAAARIGNPHPAKWKEGKLSGPPAGCVSMVLERGEKKKSVDIGNDSGTKWVERPPSLPPTWATTTPPAGNPTAKQTQFILLAGQVASE
ncbi:hypothetical protein F9C07_7200 [Aspergillus flavus]|uniref:Uncharacterized protein n=1 Tax=Aspergillus flavus (strain ATCC 200026 / FGSC A1120 / IAM 13836 / NRRL 3357 / JCM 12722 / SRRC 167) TaxID=332952 RepID=A0A7U2MMF1_ASPFN|nr:hypothetical protein F9C07_7200 [Aspergillus flavus]